MKISTLGGNGTGKETQSKLLEKRLGIKHRSTGAVVKGQYPEYRHLTEQFRKGYEAGNLAPDEMMNPIARELIEGLTSFNLEGFPRTIKQAQFLYTITALDEVLYLYLPKELAIERAVNRRICKNTDCNEVYGLDRATNPDNSCVTCQSPTYQRPDDTPEKAGRRYDNELREIEPVLNFYHERDILAPINATGTPEQVNARIIEALGYAKM